MRKRVIAASPTERSWTGNDAALAELTAIVTTA